MAFNRYTRILYDNILAIPSIDVHNSPKRSIIKTISNWLMILIKTILCLVIFAKPYIAYINRDCKCQSAP